MAFRLQDIITPIHNGTVDGNNYTTNQNLGAGTKNLMCDEILTKKIIFEVSEKNLIIGVSGVKTPSYPAGYVAFIIPTGVIYRGQGVTGYHTLNVNEYAGTRLLHVIIDVQNSDIRGFDANNGALCFVAKFDIKITEYFHLGFNLLESGVMSINPSVDTFQYQPKISYDVDLGYAYNSSITYKPRKKNTTSIIIILRSEVL